MNEELEAENFIKNNCDITSCGINLNESERATICKVMKNLVPRIELQRKN